MTRGFWFAAAVAASVVGCSSALTPYATAPLAAQPGVKDAGPRVAICYNPLKSNEQQVQELAQAECVGNAAAERVDTDYRLDGCPVMTPGRATFVCKPK